MKIRDKFFDLKNEAYIMGILNVTPDSFSDGGTHNTVDEALKHTERMIKEGASIIDIGGESTRPGYTPVSSDEELHRILPVIEKIRANFDVVISIDTFKSKTYIEAVKAGADILNDIWGLKADENMAKAVKDTDTHVIIMHNKDNNEYENLMDDLIKETMQSVDIAIKAGISKDKIILDPGIGFALSYEKDLTVINQLEKFVEIGYPVLLGTSRKRVIKTATGIEVPSERGVATAATTAIGVMKGASIFRVHDVKENYEAMKMALAIRREGK